MKKLANSRIGLILGRILNFRAWLDFDRIKSYTSYLLNAFKRIFIPQPPQKGESFKAASSRFELSKQDLENKQIALFRLSILMCAIGAGIFAYAIYHLFYGSYRAALVSLVIALIALALAFRYNFWYFQIKKRKLGCSVEEWYKQSIRGDK